MKKGKNDVHKYMLKFVAVQPANEGTYTCTVTFQDDSEKEMETDLSFIGMNCFEYCAFFVTGSCHSISYTLFQWACPSVDFHQYDSDASS